MDIYFFGSTATNTNYVRITAKTSGSSYTWTHDHFVNFNLPYGHRITDTFPVYFGVNTNLTIDASTQYDPPTGKTYKIAYIQLNFTRIA